MIDVNILRVLGARKDYMKLRGAVPDTALEPITKVILDDFGEYFQKFSGIDSVQFEDFWTWFSKFKHPAMKDDQKNSYAAVIRQACAPPNPAIKDALLSEMHELRLATTVGRIAEDWANGDCQDISSAISLAHTQYKKDMGVQATDFIKTDIGDLLKEEEDASGLRWRLDTLNMCMRGLRAGDMGIIAARPDKGKTSFFASELTYLAKQLPPNKPLIWLNNEGMGKRIIPRLYQAALGVPLSALVDMHKHGKLVPAYEEAINGKATEKIKIYDVHGFNVTKIESIIEECRPAVVVADMIDHFKGFQNEARTDLVLEEMYKWFREMGVKYGSINLASSQISNEGDGLQFPTLGMLKDSKTGKQGACDFLMMIGASNDPALAGSRFIGLPKNKLRREGAAGDPRAEVFFKPQICRYEDVAIGS